METLEVISNKKRQWVRRVHWLRNVHNTPKNNLSSTAADTFGTLFQTPSVNGLGYSAYSTLSLVTTHHNFLNYAHCFNWPVLLLTPLSPTCTDATADVLWSYGYEKEGVVEVVEGVTLVSPRWSCGALWDLSVLALALPSITFLIYYFIIFKCEFGAHPKNSGPNANPTSFQLLTGGRLT